MYTASWTAVIHRRHPERNYVEQLEAKMKEIGVGQIGVCYPDVTMQWTVITAGIV